MIITNHFTDIYPLQEYTHTYVGRDGLVQEEKEVVLAEHELCLYVNQVPVASITCIPMLLTEVVLGRLLTEGWISSKEDMESLTISPDGKRADVILKSSSLAKANTPGSVAALTSSCIKPEDHLSEVVSTTPSLQKPNRKALVQNRKVSPIDWETSWIFDLADAFAKGMPFHSRTFATHSCFLSRKGEILFDCEDIGRHNALDKVIGYALKNEIPLGECVFYSSGRVPLDMVEKVILAGIPVYASKAAPTAQAIDLARRANLTLLCAARRDRFKRYN